MDIIMNILNAIDGYGDLFVTHPMAFLVCFALGITVGGSITCRFYKNKLDANVINERNLFENDLSREREKNIKLTSENEKLTEVNQNLEAEKKNTRRCIMKLLEEKVEMIDQIIKLVDEKEVLKGKMKVLLECFGLLKS